jgi:hypothetical protein
MLADRLRQDDGVALIYVLLASVIISGLVVVFMSRTLFETRSTARAAAWESAIHVGEAGAEALFGQINVEGEAFGSKVVTRNPDGTFHEYDPDPTWTDAELRAYEREWAMALALEDWEAGQAAGYDSRVIETDDGHAFGIRPKVPGADEAWEIVFGVGFVPSIDHDDPTVRLVKMRINRYYFATDNALLSGGSIYLSGNASILAPGCSSATPHFCDANVHANGDFRGGGSASEIQGTLSVTGTGADAFTTVNGPGLNGEQEVPVPPIRALDFYNRPGAETEDWYDLCRNGAGNTPVVRSPGSAPCTGEQIWPAPDNTSTSFRGWTFQTQGPDGPRWVNQSIAAGVYYVHHANATVSGAAGTNVPVTLLMGSNDSATSDSAEALGGSLKITGGPVLVPAIPDVQYIVDRDLELRGTQGAGEEPCDPNTDPDCDPIPITGFVYVGEQLAVNANVTVNGAMIVEDREDRHPWVRRTAQGEGVMINGNLTLNYDRNLRLDLRGRVTIEYWNEL